MQLIPEPRREVAGMEAVQPKRDRPQLHGNRVQVDAKTVPVGDIGPYLLLLDDNPVLRDRPASLLLLPLKVEIGKLICGFDQKGRRTHGRLEDLEFKKLVGGQVPAPLHQRMLDEEPRQRFRCVVGRGFFPVPAGEAVNEGPLGIDQRFRTVEYNLFWRELADPVARHEPAWGERIDLVAAERLVLFGFLIPEQIFFDVVIQIWRVRIVPVLGLGRVVRPPLSRFQLDEVCLRDDPREGNERFIDRTKLTDPELGIGDPARALSGGPEREEPDHLLDRLVAQHQPVQ